MCYLVAKNKNAHGCYALKTVHGIHLVDLKRQLNQFAVPHGIQLVTISRPNAYGEYAPYHILDSEEDFVQTVRKLFSPPLLRLNMHTNFMRFSFFKVLCFIPA